MWVHFLSRADHLRRGDENQLMFKTMGESIFCSKLNYQVFEKQSSTDFTNWRDAHFSGQHGFKGGLSEQKARENAVS